jgi:hypothetical protein
MDRAQSGERAFAATTPPVQTEAIDFVRFCHRRRRVGWPELYDEMCAVAGRGLYRGYGPEDLTEIGISFGLFQMPALAGLVAQVVAEDVERRRRSAEALRVSVTVEGHVGSAVVVAEGTAAAVLDDRAPSDDAAAAADTSIDVRIGPLARPIQREPIETGRADHPPLRIALAAGA